MNTDKKLTEEELIERARATAEGVAMRCAYVPERRAHPSDRRQPSMSIVRSKVPAVG